MSFWGRLFGAQNTIDKAVDAAIATGDKLVYTDEERAEANKQILEWSLRFREATKGSRVARRLLAVMFASVFLLLIVLASLLAAFDLSGSADRILEIVADTLVTPMGLIIAFYFSAGMVTEFNK